jgi:hypothetical protein
MSRVVRHLGELPWVVYRQLVYSPSCRDVRKNFRGLRFEVLCLWVEHYFKFFKFYITISRRAIISNSKIFLKNVQIYLISNSNQNLFSPEIINHNKHEDMPRGPSIGLDDNPTFTANGQHPDRYRVAQLPSRATPAGGIRITSQLEMQS